MALFGKKKDDQVIETEANSEAVTVKDKKAPKKSVKSARKAEGVPFSYWSSRRDQSLPEDALKRMRITEKSAILSTKKAYTFLVDRKYGKQDIMRAFVKAYGKTPVKINIVNIPGKTKRTRTGLGRTSAKKKAIVYLGGKDKIDFV